MNFYKVVQNFTECYESYTDLCWQDRHTLSQTCHKANCDRSTVAQTLRHAPACQHQLKACTYQRGKVSMSMEGMRRGKNGCREGCKGSGILLISLGRGVGTVSEASAIVYPPRPILMAQVQVAPYWLQGLTPREGNECLLPLEIPPAACIPVLGAAETALVELHCRAGTLASK